MIRRLSSLFVFSSLFILISSCGMVQNIAIDTTADILFEGTAEIETESNWELVREALPANLKMLEGMLYLDPENEDLLVSLTKGYGGIGYAINETLALNEKYRDVDNGKYWTEAVYSYSRAVTYGLRFLEQNDVPYSKLQKLINVDNGIIKLLEDEVGTSTRDLEGVFYTAQSLGGLIMLKQTDMTLVAQLPIVKGLFDWVCMKKPDMNYGACDLFYAAYEAARPRMLGGNPEKGRELFEKLIKKQPHNWMARTEFLRYYIIPMEEEDLYVEQRRFFKDAKRRFNAHRMWKPGKEVPDEFKQKRLRLYQAIALKRFEMIKKFEKDLF